jgi:UDP-galactopyranose mutase
MNKYDFLIIGAGLYGSTFAYNANKHGYKCLVLDKRNHIGGNLYCENISNINVHKFGAHIFHTSNKLVWDFVNSFSEFNRYINSPIAISRGKLYNLPFNMNTFYQLWGVKTPEEAQNIINEQTSKYKNIDPVNLEEQALKLVGPDIYYTLIKEYTEKQWGKKATELPAFIIRRLPLRFRFDNNYFNDIYQGIPISGYNKIFNGLLSNIDIELEVDFVNEFEYFKSFAKRIIYTGEIDRLFNYCYGPLEYRGLKFEHEVLQTSNFQGNAVINYIDSDVPYTRIIEHKHFEFGDQKDTIITKEYSINWSPGQEPYYPINDESNNNLYEKYKLLLNDSNIMIGGRLADYKYYDMNVIIENVLKIWNNL